MIKLKNEQQKPLTDEDKVLIYELSSMCQLMCSQSSNLFTWSEMEVRVQGQHARTRRTPQEKVIDKQISLLFPSQNILTFIAIIFRDMDIAARMISLQGGSDPSLKKESKFIQKINMKTREAIRKFFGDYLSKCKDFKYNILEAFMKGVVFEKKKLRETYLQEILKSHVDSGCKSSIEEYLVIQKFVLDIGQKERICSMQWVEVAIGQSSAYNPKLLLLTNKGIHIQHESRSKYGNCLIYIIMKPPSGKPCTVCPLERLCPSGPRQEIKFKYERLADVITFPDLPQKLVFAYLPSNASSQVAQTSTLSIIVPTISGSDEVSDLLKEILTFFQPKTKVRVQKDYMLRGALERNLTKLQPESELVFSLYMSHNPSKGFLGFGGGGSIISNCSLLVLTKTEIVIYRENWQKWVHVAEKSNIESLLQKLNNGDAGDELVPQAQKQKEVKMMAAFDEVLTQSLRRGLDEIENLHVHKGKDPVIEIEVTGGRIEKLIFMCDYSRQQFIQALIKSKNGEDQTSSEAD